MKQKNGIKLQASTKAKSAIITAFATIFAVLPSFAHAQSMIRDAEIETMLRDYSNPIFTAAGLNPKDISLNLINDRSLNAFVTDGQKMFINTGLILEVRTPNQLKGVIAHETGHIAGGHLARSSEAERNAMVPAYVTIALGLLAMASGAGDAGAALLASSQQFAILSFFTYTRVQEASADQAALTYLDATHQSGDGLVRFFEKFRYMEVMSDARRQPYFRSHPLSTDRIDALERRANQSPYIDAQDNEEDIDRLKMVQAKIQGFLYTSEQTFYKYPPSDRSIYGRYARAIAFYRAPDIATATAMVRGLIREQPDNEYFQELMGQIYFENGKSNEALPFYKRSIEIAPDEALLQIGYARVLINLGGEDNFALAEDALRKALRLEDDNAFAWNQLAIVADRRNQPGLARLATAEEAFSLGDMQRANRFAQVAKRNLERASPQWQRASDIQSITDPIVAKEVRRGEHQ